MSDLPAIEFRVWRPEFGTIPATPEHFQLVLVNQITGEILVPMADKTWKVIAVSADEKVRVSENDDAAQFLADKITADYPLDIGIDFPGSVETVNLSLQAASIDATYLANNGVTTPKVADDAVTLAKLAHGTPNRLIGFNASGVPSEIIPSTGSGVALITITAGEALVYNDAIYRSPSDGKWYKVDANALPIKCGTQRGFCREEGGILTDATGQAVVRGVINGFTGLSPHVKVYASTTAGGYTQTKPLLTAGGGQVAIIPLGEAISSTEIDVMDLPVSYMKREMLALSSNLTVEHHPDALPYLRKLSAYVSRDGADVLAEYPVSNYDADSPIKRQTVATYGSDITSGGTPSANSIFSGAYTQWHAFDKNVGTMWINGGGLPAWLEYDFGTPKAIRQYTIVARIDAGSQGPTSWTFEYYNGSSWVAVDTKTGQAPFANGESRTFSFSSSVSAARWRIYITATQDTFYASIAELYMREVATYNNGFVSLAQSFQVSSPADALSFGIVLSKAGSPTNNVRFKLRSDSGGNPGTVLATTEDIAASTLSSSGTLVVLDLPTAYTLSSGTTYWIEIEWDGAQSEFNFIRIGVDSTSSSYGSGTLKAWNGSSWADALLDGVFQVLSPSAAYEGALSIGGWMESSPAVLNRYDNGADANPETHTTFRNNLVNSLDITCIVELP